VRDETPPSDEELARLLDELVMAYHVAPEGAPAEDEIEPPASNPKAAYSALASRFPNLELYAVADSAEPINDSPMVGDAIEDLADIARDLDEVVWRSDNFGPDDAYWHFKLLYRIHWGCHVRELSSYLHAKLW
jgi:hypothetical protein